MNKRMQAAEQLRRALQLYANTLTEAQALEVAAVYPAWAAGRSYAVGGHRPPRGEQRGGPPALQGGAGAYLQADWTPEATPALYDAFGLDEAGYPIWSQPTGAHDAYNAGDIVNYNGTLYKSLIDGNTWSPEAYPDGWEVYTP